jgi:hypothetical protein
VPSMRSSSAGAPVDGAAPLSSQLPVAKPNAPVGQQGDRAPGEAVSQLAAAGSHTRYTATYTQCDTHVRCSRAAASSSQQQGRRLTGRVTH